MAGLAKRTGCVAAGSWLLYSGLRHRRFSGFALALAGGSVLWRGLLQSDRSLPLPTAPGESNKPFPYGEGNKIHAEVTVDKPAAELYRFWHDFENLPCFMEHLESVKKIDETQSHWVAKGPFGSKVSWDAEIIADRENEMIGWRSMKGSQIHQAGSVRFEPLRRGRATRVSVTMQYHPAGVLAAGAAKVFRRDPERQIQNELRRFKQFAESTDLGVLDRLLHRAA
jgi:uncharacterized membrane protein